MSAEDLTSKLSPPLQSYFHHAPCFMTVLNRNGRILAANENFGAVFGDAADRRCFQVYKKREKICQDCPVQATFADGKPHSSNQTITLPDGSPMQVLVYTSPIFGPDGSVQTVVEVLADITPVKVLEEKLRQNRERYRLLFEEVPCYISVQDRDLRIVQCNRSFQEDFGQYIGAYCYEIYKHRGEPCLNCPVARTFQDGKAHESEEVVVARDGRTINTLVSTAPIRNASGEIEMVMEISTNITEIRKLQDELTNLGLLVGSVSHGIKGLLTGLDGGMYLLNTGVEKGRPERVEEGWQMVRRNVEQIRSVVLDLLYIAKEREPAWESVSLLETARAAAEVVRAKAERQGVSLEISLEDAGKCEAEPKSLQASFVNLLENALDACRIDKHKESHTVRFTLREEEGCAIAAVEDNGIGMDQETREKLFTLFFSSKGLEGTGLGLFIAHKVIQKHGGTLHVDSDPGRGSRFTVRLPKNIAGSRMEPPA
jgi:PAS domain S-box-containing protein